MSQSRRSVLTLTLQPTKAFRLLWTRVPGSTHYRLFEDPTGSYGFTQVGGDIAASATSFDHIVPLYRRVNARYVLQAIGYFKASNPDAHDVFGRSVTLSSDGLTLAVGAPQRCRGACRQRGHARRGRELGKLPLGGHQRAAGHGTIAFFGSGLCLLMRAMHGQHDPDDGRAAA